MAREQSGAGRWRRWLPAAAVILLAACGGNSQPSPKQSDTGEVVGFTTVPLDLRRNTVRSVEAAAGNLVADALVERATGLGHGVHAAFTNGGGLRFNVQTHPDGIIPAGELKHGDIEDMLPFGNGLAIVRMSGAELKSTLERSVAQLPSSAPHGAFLQLSRELRIQVDLSRPAQLLDNRASVPVVVREGERIVAATVRGLPLEPGAEYLVATNDFLANGGDGYAALAAIPAARKIFPGLRLLDLVLEHLRLYSPVTPLLEGRIRFLGG